MTSELLRCEGLVKIFPLDSGEVVALQGLDLTVHAGETVGVVGVSGSGKSTMLGVASGVLTPTAGRVFFDGEPLAGRGSRALDEYRRRDLGFLWQDPASGLVPSLDALGNVALPLRLDGAADADEQARSMLDAVGLGSRLRHRLSELSGGELQRVALAAALVHRPRLLLADEPTGQLDGATTSEVLALMRQLSEAWGVAQLIVSHDPRLVNHVDRVVSIRDGRRATEQAIGESGEVEEVLVVDAAGRLQLPADQRDQTGIADAVVSEVVDGSIVLRPAPVHRRGDRPARPGDVDGESDEGES